eukprot:scaffold78_cov203-Ochromonas_danica.AAC.2
MQSSLEKPDVEEEKRKAEEVRSILEKRGRVEVEEMFYGLLDDIPHKVQKGREVDLERKLEECRVVSELEESIKAREKEEARRVEAERKLEECQAVNEKVVSELEESIKARETEEARRVEAERKLEEALALNDKLLAQQKDGQIAILLLNCHANWQKMIESGDLTALKTLETYNAIHRIPVSVIHHHFTMTLGHTKIKGMTALHMAAVRCDMEMSRLLLLHPAIDVNAVCVVDSEDGWTPLHTACRNGRVGVVRFLLLDGRVEVNKACVDGYTPLHTACLKGHVEVVLILLLDGRVDVNKANKHGRTPLHAACRKGHIEVVLILLLDGRVDVNKTDKNGKTALTVAKTEDIKALLRAKGAI